MLFKNALSLLVLITMAISGCINPKVDTADDDPCVQYARTAGEQFHEGQRRNCGIEDDRFHDNFEAHYQWCKEVGLKRAARGPPGHEAVPMSTTNPNSGTHR